MLKEVTYSASGIALLNPQPDERERMLDSIEAYQSRIERTPEQIERLGLSAARHLAPFHVPLPLHLAMIGVRVH